MSIYYVPNYLTHFYRTGQKPFQNICDLGIEAAERILLNDIDWRGDGTYLSARIRHEELLWLKFTEVGGIPKRKHPIYMILGDSPTGPHDLHNEYDHKIILPLSIFKPEDVGFTYPDSMYKLPLNELDKLYLERNEEPHVYRMEELAGLIKIYEVYKYNNHYIEAQVWNDKPIIDFL